MLSVETTRAPLLALRSLAAIAIVLTEAVATSPITHIRYFMPVYLIKESGTRRITGPASASVGGAAFAAELKPKIANAVTLRQFAAKFLPYFLPGARDKAKWNSNSA